MLVRDNVEAIVKTFNEVIDDQNESIAELLDDRLNIVIKDDDEDDKT
jgi:hypothetical protein